MKKIILRMIALVGFAGCTTVSPYNKGCRAGVAGWNQGVDQEKVDDFCSDLDRIQKALEKAGRSARG